MSEHSNLEIIKEAYASFGRGDIDAVLAVEDPDTVLEIAGPTEIPWAGSYRGHEGARKYFSTIAAEADFDVFEPHSFMAQDDSVVVVGFERVRARRTGRSYENHWAHVFTLANGKIVKFREYCDTATVAAAFRRR